MKYLVLISIVSINAQVPFVNSFLGSVIYNGLGTGLSAYYKFDEGAGNAVATVGGIDLTATGAPASAVGLIVNSRTLTTAGTDYFMTTDNSIFEAGAGSFTVAFWIKLATLPTLGTDQGAVTKWVYSGSGSWGVEVFNYSAGVAGFNFKVSETGLDYGLNHCQLDVDLVTGSWYCVIARFDQSLGMSYLSVRKVSDIWYHDDDNFPTTTMFNSTARLAVGGWEVTGGGATIDPANRLSSGTQIEEMGFWARSLNDCEMEKFYNLGTARAHSTYDTGICL